MTRHRVIVVPPLRRLGSVLVERWLAITIGRLILAWRPLDEVELEHELEHVRQWERHGFTFPLTYFAESLRARRAGGRWYHDNRFEAEARKAASRLAKR